MSVKERAKHLNKIQSETELQRVQLRKRDPKPKAAHDDDDSSTASVTLTDVEREWMMLSSKCDYHPMAKILLTNPQLAKKPDFTNGMTALHWAAKHGSSDTVKMIAGTPGVNVNQRSHGGYTPLHLAALHGHEAIVELLVQCYGADPNIRDYSGKKPKQYLKNSASSKTQRKNSDSLTASLSISTWPKRSHQFTVPPSPSVPCTPGTPKSVFDFRSGQDTGSQKNLALNVTVVDPEHSAQSMTSNA
ncbi:ankyrin repeat domain-containing protein SOWAHC isoform X2 [Lingula anatina]|nr:ankyrin repeat domain-containing protein SOWAHC isoform X2 [Lingula anatina]XP_013404061.1 ankyrin repeat domain-containing protein SOWAHC isoform X2 [Lingula anatina]XP_013404062.1 ankyrin repeat domain-containing protein SOWAHC isoform X2 [Lingula anatina]|eukprot:XP_013404060.1 ankyrin repeat domain-containing protein SOWAHC isoform X2 [Lingula anatina]